jgi:hypothetical protein
MSVTRVHICSACCPGDWSPRRPLRVTQSLTGRLAADVGAINSLLANGPR